MIYDIVGREKKMWINLMFREGKCYWIITLKICTLKMWYRDVNSKNCVY